MDTPYEVIVFTVEDVLMDIYDGEIEQVDTVTATQAFSAWLGQHDANYFSAEGPEQDIIMNAILDTIKKRKRIVVIHVHSASAD